MRLANTIVTKLFLCLFLMLGLGSFAQADTIGFDLLFLGQDEDSGSYYDEGMFIGDHDTGIGYEIVYSIKPSMVLSVVEGLFNIDYTPSMTNVGTASISMDFSGSNAMFRAMYGIGGNINLWAGGDKLTLISFLDLVADSGQYVPTLGQKSEVVKDDMKIEGGIPIVASVGAGIGGAFTFEPQSLSGALCYGPRGEQTICDPFAMDGPRTLSINLDQPGIWDFSFNPFYLSAELITDVSVNVTASIMLQDVASYPIINLHQYSNPYYIVNKEGPGNSNVFSISVGDGAAVIPEPTSLLLLGTGLGALGLVACRRKRK